MRILGLDLGVGSIGWCLIEADENRVPLKILAIGSRIMSVSPDETKYFERGKGETACGKRTFRRTARKCNNRYKMRRSRLKALLNAFGMYDTRTEEALRAMPPLSLWGLRAKAATEGEQLSLQELSRVLLHINQKRGYRHAKEDASSKEQTDYVKKVNARYATITELGLTIGQYHFRNLKGSAVVNEKKGDLVTHSLKNEVYPRHAHLEEFNRIMDVQSKFWPELLTESNIEEIRNAIFFQRPLKSCKHLVSLCEFEKHDFLTSGGKKIEIGPKVAPRTSPIAQLTRIYESVNNISLVNRANRKHKKADSQPSLFDAYPEPRDLRLMQYEYSLNNEERQRVADYLNTHEILTVTMLLKLLGLKKTDGFVPDKAVGRGIKGNDTYVRIARALGVDPDSKDDQKYKEFLRFDIPTTDYVNTDTGEVLPIVAPAVIEQPLYMLWHTLYSISDKEELSKVLREKFGLEDETVIDSLSAIDFTTAGFSNRSAKYMRKLLPRLIEGEKYSDAAAAIGVNHSNSVTRSENDARQLKSRLTPLRKNSLRQPLIERILNQMVNIVNALLEKYGEIDEARVELARSLKQSKDERIKATSDIAKREKENKEYADIIEKEYHLVPTRRRIQKYRLWLETSHRCMYCGDTVGAAEFLNSHDVEIEHIIPKKLYFDDSMSNKTCACSQCNKDKNNRTAMDYISKRPEVEQTQYLERVERLYAEHKISKRKHDYLLMHESEIPADFLERDLRQSQYIARKAMEILREAIRNVWASSGTVTDFFRHAWGYDMILHDLNLPRYEKAGMVKEEEYTHKGQTHVRKVIEGWSKRLDHRHHAIDALVIALTGQGYIQRLNNLSAEHGNLYNDMTNTDPGFRHHHSLLSQWAETRPHFSTSDVSDKVEGIAVSHKAGKKVTTPGNRKIRNGRYRKVVQRGIQVPRGALHEESVNGKILLPGEMERISKAFEHPQLVIDPEIRGKIEQRIEAMGGDREKAKNTLARNPITVMRKGKQKQVKAVRCYREEFVMKYKIGDIKIKDIPYVIDHVIRRRLEERAVSLGNDEKKYVKSLTENPILGPDGITAIKTVRCVTGNKAGSMVGVRKDGQGEIIGYAKGGNNHHAAIYRTAEGKLEQIVVSFWVAVKRKNHGLPVIVDNPAEAWDQLMAIEDEAEREALCQNMPSPTWTFVESMQLNDMFVLGLSKEEFDEAVHDGDMKKLLKHLYRVQKLSNNDYYFRLHTVTTAEKGELVRNRGDYYRLSLDAFQSLNPQKVTISLLGRILLR